MSKVQEEIDKNLYNIICDVWNAYRDSSKEGNAQTFNNIFMSLHDEYEHTRYTSFIQQLGFALTPFMNEAVKNNGE